jgi:hypothetical protein
LPDFPGAVQRTVFEKSDIAAVTQGIQTFRIPSRNDRYKCGTKGRPIIVETNHLALDLTKVRNNIVIHYDVTLDPSVPKRLFRYVRLPLMVYSSALCLGKILYLD